MLKPTEPTNVARDLAELFADTDASTRLEALRIRTKHLRLFGWAAVVSAVCGGLWAVRWFVVWKFGA